MLKKHLDFVEL